VTNGTSNFGLLTSDFNQSINQPSVLCELAEGNQSINQSIVTLSGVEGQPSVLCELAVRQSSNHPTCNKKFIRKEYEQSYSPKKSEYNNKFYGYKKDKGE
jgi:hypothetical protein